MRDVQRRVVKGVSCPSGVVRQETSKGVLLTLPFLPTPEHFKTFSNCPISIIYISDILYVFT